MASIGNSYTTQGFIPAVDYFNGNGSTTAFTLSRPVASVAQVQAVIENVPQNPGDAYTVSGNTITFTSAPPSGTSNIYVYYTSPITQLIAPGQDTVGIAQLSATGTPSSSTYLRGDNSWASVGAIGDIFYENGQTVTSNYTITTGKNAMSAGPITIDSGVTVTVPTGSTWVVV
jgi:hypothetical protein